MAATNANATTARTTSPPTTTNVPQPVRDPTPAQLHALKNFGCDLPPGIDRATCSRWMDHLIGKVKAGEKITAEDLSGPPVFTPASEIIPRQTAPAHPSPAPVVPGEPATTNEETTPAPSDYLPTSDSWGTVEYELTTDAEGNVTGSRFYAKVASHPAPGESWDDLLDRIGHVAATAATNRAGRV